MSLERITQMAQLLLRHESQIAQLEEELSAEKAAALKLKREDLPELMREFNLLEFTLTSGEKIEVKEDIQCAITDERKNAAFDWLREHGFSGLIKTVVSVEFERGDIDRAELLALQLAAQELPAIMEEKVHPATLKSFINGELEAGRTVPFNLFGIVPFSFAKVIKPSKKGAKS